MKIVEFAVLGLGGGAVYALLAQGMVLTYRGSGVLNLAHGAMAMAGAYFYWELTTGHGWPVVPAFAAACVFAGAIGALVHLVVMRRLRSASVLMKVIASLGVLAVLQGIATIRYGSFLKTVATPLPQHTVHLLGTTVSADRLYLLGIAVVVTMALHLISRHTLFGLLMSAVADNERSAATSGWSPDVIATITWAAGGMVAAAAGILIVPIIGLNVSGLTQLVVAALAAALVGQFVSFPMTLVGGLLIGVLESVTSGYVYRPGIASSVPLVIIIAILVLRGSSLPVRGQLSERLPSVGSGRISWRMLALAVVAAIGCLLLFPQSLQVAMTSQIIAAVIILSVVVVTGYAGQLSLAQFSIAGISALVTAKLVAEAHWPFEVSFVVGVLCAIAVGVAFGLPGLRTRGLNLAVVTLGLGIVVQNVVFDNSNYTGGFNGLQVGSTHVFGISIDPLEHPQRYGLFCMVCLVVTALIVTNVRRGRVGRRMIAVRENEKAAAAIGINVASTKLYAFGLSSLIAGVGGVLLAFQNYSITFDAYNPAASIAAVGNSVIGGLGYVPGAVAGSTLASGGIVPWILDRFGSLDEWLPLISGVGLLAIVLANPEGIVGALVGTYRTRVRARPTASVHRSPDSGPDRSGDRAVDCSGDPSVELVLEPIGVARRGRPTSGLVLRDIHVRYGGVSAVKGVDLHVGPGTIVGVIGPNGAGKTSLLDAVSGFARLVGGSVELLGNDVTNDSAYRRSRRGMSRTFQSVELFRSMTVSENIQVAVDPRDFRAYLTNLIWRHRTTVMSRAALDAIAEFGLGDVLEAYPTELSQGQRQLVGLARAIATGADILLLDEPAAGLDDTETGELLRILRRLAKEWGLGIMLVEHDMNLVMRACDRVAVLDFGTKLTEGGVDEVRTDPAVISAYLGVTAMTSHNLLASDVGVAR
jgi:ABC-type branched-subunit amino acid transport system ATPase component/branched-subunit amino acid ABC-type transport system permease component